ncbi:MAG: hypothetical protein OXH83_03150 [Bryobacterales bacterium]|nr:hypothetical protein [Bryobacterales bacterium]
MHIGNVQPPRSVGATRWHVTLLVALAVAVASCGAGNEGQTPRSGNPDAQVGDTADGTPSTPVPTTGHPGRVVRNRHEDGSVVEYSMFVLGDCGLCPRDPDMDWRSDFSNSFLGEGESCDYAPLMLVDGDQLTGWAEGDEGDGVGVDVVVPQLLDLTQSVRIWAGYGRSPELFAANGRPKRVEVTVLRLRAVEPDPHDATGCSSSAYVEPVAVAGHEVALRDFNGYQALRVPEFQLEHYLEYPMEWLLMDGTERMSYQQRVDAGEAAPFEREPTEYTYLLRLTLVEVYPGTRYADTVITEIGNGLP